MKRNIIVIADPHLGSSHSLYTWNEFMDILARADENTLIVLLGDVIDIKGVKKKHVGLWRSRQEWLETVQHVVYLFGNHDKKAPKTQLNYVFIFEGVLYTHGAKYICYSDEKMHECEIGRGGRGFFSYRIYAIYKVGITGSNRNLDKPYTLSQERIDNCISLVKQYRLKGYNIHTIRIGHVHGPSSVYIEKERLTIETCKRGETYYPKDLE